MHAIALVLGPDVRSQLYYFSERRKVEPYLNQTKEEIIEYGKKTLEHYREEYKGKKLYENEKYSQHFVDFINNILPKTKEWTDDEIHSWYVKYYMDEDDIGEDGCEYSTDNPDGFYDFYLIGGRFGGTLYLKEGVEFSIEEHSCQDYTEDEIEILKKQRRADSCLLKELDIERMKDGYNNKKTNSHLRYIDIIIKNSEFVEYNNPIEYLKELLKIPENGDLEITVVDYHY